MNRTVSMQLMAATGAGVQITPVRDDSGLMVAADFTFLAAA